MATDPAPHIAVVTQPLGAVGRRQARPFLDLLDEHATVTVITGGDRAFEGYDCRLYTGENTRDGGVGAGLQFVENQVRISRHLRRVNPDVAWFYGSTLYTLPIGVARASGQTVVTQPKGDVPLALYLNSGAPAFVRRGLASALRTLNRAGFAASDYIVTYCDAMADEYSLNGQKTLTNGARYIDDRFSVRTAIDDRPLRVGYLGRHADDKNIESLVEAARELNVPFHFAGDGPRQSWVADQLADVPLTAVHGWIDDVVEYLNQLKLLVLPATPIEGLPTVILEALACGTPVVATPVAGIPDVVADGETGLLLPDAEPLSIVNGVNAALAWNLPVMSERCRAIYETRFTRDAAVDRYGELVEAVA